MNNDEFKIVRTDDDCQDILGCDNCHCNVATIKADGRRLCRICYTTQVGIKGFASRKPTNKILAQVANLICSEIMSQQQVWDEVHALNKPVKTEGLGDFANVVVDMLKGTVSVHDVEKTVKEMTAKITGVMVSVMLKVRELVDLENRDDRNQKAVEIRSLIQEAGFYNG